MQTFKLASYEVSIHSVSWSQSGAHLCVGLQTGEVIYRILSHTVLAQCSATFYPMLGVRHCSRSVNRTHIARVQVALWDINRMAQLRIFQGHTNTVSALSWNSHLLSSAGREGTILNRDMRVPEDSVAALRGHRGHICGLKVAVSAVCHMHGNNITLNCCHDTCNTSNCSKLRRNNDRVSCRLPAVSVACDYPGSRMQATPACPVYCMPAAHQRNMRLL